MRISDDWPRGVLPALEEWLQTPEGSDFTVRRDLELYGISCHPSGFLQRRPTQPRGHRAGTAATEPVYNHHGGGPATRR